MEKQTDFSAYAKQNEYDVELKDLEVVKIETLENQKIDIQGAWTAESKKWKGSLYAVLLLPDKRFTMGGSVIAGQVDAFKKDEKTYPATAIVLKRTSKQNGKDYFVLG